MSIFVILGLPLLYHGAAPSRVTGPLRPPPERGNRILDGDF